MLAGAFIPFLKELKRRRQPYLVLEQNKAALKPEEMPFYRPADLAPEIVPYADVLLITGATLLNDTLEDLLALARPGARVTVVGPTVGAGAPVVGTRMSASGTEPGGIVATGETAGAETGMGGVSGGRAVIGDRDGAPATGRGTSTGEGIGNGAFTGIGNGMLIGPLGVPPSGGVTIGDTAVDTTLSTAVTTGATAAVTAAIG